ncbi:MAG: transposase, partial [Coleofasciculus chthonoplastes F3-SA18-01]
FWYGLRSWIESSYRDIKSDGWQWHKTRLREPDRAERIWLAMAIATLWAVTLGSEKQQHLSKQFNDKTKPNSRINSKSASRRKERNISCFLQGLINIIADLICGKGISLNGLFPRQSFSLNTS